MADYPAKTEKANAFKIDTASVAVGITPIVGVIAEATNAVLAAAAEKKDRPSNTQSNRDSSFDSVKEDAERFAGDRPEDPNLLRFIFELREVEAFTKVGLAERLGRPDLFNRRAGARPKQVTRRTSGLVNEEQFDALYHEPKPDTQAVLRIVRVNPQASRFRDAAIAPQPFDILCETAEFLLQSGQEQDSEKFQISNTFDLPRLHLMGRRARIFTYTGLLVNSENLQWKNRFLYMYDRSLRGTRALENGAIAQLIYDDVLREGYILSNSISPNVGQLNVVPFTFSMFITRTVALADVNRIRCPEEFVIFDLIEEITAYERPRVFSAAPGSPAPSPQVRKVVGETSLPVPADSFARTPTSTGTPAASAGPAPLATSAPLSPDIIVQSFATPETSTIPAGAVASYAGAHVKKPTSSGAAGP